MKKSTILLILFFTSTAFAIITSGSVAPDFTVRDGNNKVLRLKNLRGKVVIGDAVNIASRVESLTKNYGVEIIITESTVKELPEDHDFNIRYLNQVKVRGREKPFKIYELLS